jgi:AcrR family transcriptional regulator
MFETGQDPDRAQTAEGSALSRQTLRAARTREALLASAQTVFARDGFEATRIEDIAAEAGRTRGAFYANFESKAEVFLALRNEQARRQARELRGRLDNLAPGESRADAVRTHLMELLFKPEEMLLEIEFKLFALRHPDMRSTLAEMHLNASTSIGKEELPELFPDQSRALAEMRRDTLAIEAILEGFALNMLFNPGVLDRADPDCAYLKQIVRSSLDQILSDKL